MRQFASLECLQHVKYLHLPIPGKYAYVQPHEHIMKSSNCRKIKNHGNILITRNEEMSLRQILPIEILTIGIHFVDHVLQFGFRGVLT